MKELIGITILIATLFSGPKLLNDLHRNIKVAALRKASCGIPALPKFIKSKRPHSY